MPLPVFTVEIDADPSTTGLFVVGTSTLNGAHVLAADHRWAALPTADVREIGIRRGRSREDQAIDVGTCTVTLDGFSGNYDPDNPSTTYQRNGEVLLRTGVGVRVKVTIAAVDYYMFTGELDSVQVDAGQDPVVTWTCVDALARLGRASFPPVPMSRGGDLSSDRASWALDYAGIATADRAVTTGTRTLAPTEGGGTVLSTLEAIALCEQGRVYASRTNVVMVTQHYEDISAASTLTISDSGSTSAIELRDIDVEPGLAQVVNSATATRPYDGERFFAENVASVERNGRHSMDVDANLFYSVDIQALADYLASRRAVAVSRAAKVSAGLYGLPDAQAVSAATLDLGDRILVERTTKDGRALSWDLHVEGIDHTISVNDWVMALSCSPRDNLYAPNTAFILDTSTLNGTAVVALY